MSEEFHRIHYECADIKCPGVGRELKSKPGYCRCLECGLVYEIKKDAKPVE
jgi:hypothetical protein